MTSSIAALAAASGDGTFLGLNMAGVVTIFTTVVLVFGGLFIGTVILFRSNRAQTSDVAQIFLKGILGLLAVALIAGGGAWVVVNQVSSNLTGHSADAKK